MQKWISFVHAQFEIFKKRCAAKDSYSLWIAAVILSGTLAYYWDTQKPRESGEATKSEDPQSVSTLIPAGFVLVPIEVANYESLDSILGKFGVVDLFQPPNNGSGQPIKVAEHVKILRAPLNPSHFAVLVPESESSRLVRFQGAFTVVVQNPSRTDGTRFVNPDSAAPARRSPGARKSRIVVESENAISL